MKLHLFTKIANSKTVQRIRSVSKKIILPGFEGQSLYVIALVFYQGIMKGALTTRASAISFNVFLAIFPTLIFLLSIIPLLPMENFQDRLLEAIAGVLPTDAHALLATTLEDLITHQHTAVFSIGFILTLYYSSNSVNTVLTCFNSSYHLQVQRNPVRQKLIALGLVIVLSSMLFVAIALSVGSDIMLGWMQSELVIVSKFSHVLYHLVRWIIVLFMFMMAVSILYNFGNKAQKWKWVSAGATLTTIIFALASAAFAYYFDHFNSYNKLYGSLGTLILVLVWIQINAIILLIGFELNASIYSAKIRQKANSD